jgi:1,4-dihydroxy-2-naphthoate octaprenyltransferase
VFKAYKLFNILSLDVVLGAIASCLFFGALLGVSLRVAGIAALGLTVWAIYTADHLIDARRLTSVASTERHRFHQLHFRALLWMLLIALAIDVFCVLAIRAAVFKYGVVLACVVLVYFVFQRKLKFMKEFFGGVLYTGGVLLPALSLHQHAISPHQQMVVVQFFLTALINLILFSLFDKDSDRQDHHPSLVNYLGSKWSGRLLIFLFCLQAAMLLVSLGAKEEWILLTMNGVLLTLFLFKRYFEKGDRFRLWGDAIFFLPFLYFILP